MLSRAPACLFLGTALLLAIPASAQSAAEPEAAAPNVDVEPVVAVLPPATKRRARRTQKKQAVALQTSLTAALAELERAPTLVDGRKNAKEQTRKVQRSKKRRHKAYKKVVERTNATHLLDLTLSGRGKRSKLKVDVLDASTFAVLGTATVKVGKEGEGPFIAELVSALDPHLPRKPPPPPPPEPEPEPEPEPAPVAGDSAAEAPKVAAAPRAASPAPAAPETAELMPPEDGGGDGPGGADESGSVMPWVFYGSSALTGLLTVGALGAGVALGVLAYFDSVAYVQSAPNAYGRAELRTQSEIKALGADALYVGAAIAGVVTVALVAGGTTFLFLE